MCVFPLSLSLCSPSFTIVFGNFELKSDSKLSSADDVYMCMASIALHEWCTESIFLSTFLYAIYIFFRFQNTIRKKKYFIFFISCFVLFSLRVSPFGRCFCVTSFLYSCFSLCSLLLLSLLLVLFCFPFRHRSVLLVLVCVQEKKTSLCVVRRHTMREKRKCGGNGVTFNVHDIEYIYLHTWKSIAIVMQTTHIFHFPLYFSLYSPPCTPCSITS